MYIALCSLILGYDVKWLGVSDGEVPEVTLLRLPQSGCIEEPFLSDHVITLQISIIEVKSVEC